MRTVEGVLRDSMDEMADRAAGAGAMAALAIAQGQAIRRRRRQAVAAAFLGAVLLVLPVGMVMRSGSMTKGDSGTAAGAPEAPPGGGTVQLGGRAVKLPTGWRVLQVTESEGSDLVEVGGSYRRIFGESVQAAPAGQRIADIVDGPPGGFAVSSFIDQGTTVSEQVTTQIIRGYPGSLQWSPQGDRLLVTVLRDDGHGGEQKGYEVIDAVSGQTAVHWLDPGLTPCGVCVFTWHRGGTEVAVGLKKGAAQGGSSGRDLLDSTQLLDAATGAATRAVPVTGQVSGPFSWSPDGRSVIARGTSAGEFRLVDVATGDSQRFPYADAVFATDDTLYAVEQSGPQPLVVFLDRSGTLLATTALTLPPTFHNGRIVLAP